MGEGKKKKSWKTTVCGIATGIGLLIPQIIAVLDSDPETAFDVKMIVAALGAMGVGFFSRDKDVSSKSSGIE